MALKEEVENAGLSLAGIESVNIHDAIKTGASYLNGLWEAIAKTVN